MHVGWRIAIAVLAGLTAGIAINRLIPREADQAVFSWFERVTGAAEPATRPARFMYHFLMYSYFELSGLLTGIVVFAVLPRRRSSDRETRCRACGYILRGLTEPRCPECGERI